MKLINMLVEYGLNGWRWPEGYYSIAQDKNYTYGVNIYAYINALSLGDYWSEDNYSGFGLLLFKGHEVAEDAATSLVTREQYEAALAAKNGGWIEWDGGECPVKKGTLVDVRYRDSSMYPERIGTKALVEGGYGATFGYWKHDGMKNDIIAYRLHQPQKAEQAKANLSECIGNCAAPVWNGEGLPPIGCFCEITDPDGMLVYGHGESGEVIAHVENTAVIRMSYGLGCFEAGFLRPLRTEAERKRDAVVEQMIKIATIYTTKSLGLDLALNSIYNFIAAGEIPGVKLED